MIGKKKVLTILLKSDTMGLEGTIFPERKEPKNIRLLFFPRGYLGLELISYGLFLLTLLFFNIYGCVFSLLASIVFISIGIIIQLNIMSDAQ